MTEQLPKIDVRPDHWEIVRNILHKHVSQHEVWAFGSRAKWTAKEYSDLDLAVITDKPLSLDVSASLSDDFSESDLPYKVDVVDWATTSESFRKIIERDRVVVQKAGCGSGIEWVEICLGEACTKIGSGATPRGGGSVYLDAGPIAFVRSQNIRNEGFSKDGLVYLDEKLAEGLTNVQVEAMDVLLNITGDSVARVCQVIEEVLPARVNQHVAIIRTNRKILWPDYLRYFLVSPAMQATMLGLAAVGATRNALTKGMIEPFSIRCPKNVDDQKAIANVLGSLDKKIDLNRRINQTLEAMAQALFKSWFVDFDPVKAKIAAKAEGSDPLRAAMSAISGKPDAELDALPPAAFDQLAATAALFPDAMEESELGEIPKGWAINQISQFGDVVCGKTPSKTNPEFFGEGIPFIKIPDMHNSVYVVSPSEQLSASGAASQAKKSIPSGSICVSCIATVGKVVITHELSQTNQQINSIVPRHPHYTIYLYFQMRAKEKEFHDLASGGSATLNMNTSTFSKVSVLMPNFEILTKFSVLVAPLFSEILLRQKESAILSETRDTLLPKLLSGEVSVTQATAEVAA